MGNFKSAKFLENKSRQMTKSMSFNGVVKSCSSYEILTLQTCHLTKISLAKIKFSQKILNVQYNHKVTQNIPKQILSYTYKLLKHYQVLHKMHDKSPTDN